MRRVVAIVGTGVILPQSPGPACAGPGVTAWRLLPTALQVAWLADAVHAPERRLQVVAGVTDRYGTAGADGSGD